MEYRSVPDERAAEFAAVLQYAFRPERGPSDAGSWEEPPPPARPGEPRGLFDGEDLVSACTHHFFSATVRGNATTLAGLSAVATPPERRRRGLVRRLVRESLAEYRERGAPLAALWPFDHHFYARLGWAIANRYTVSECPPETLASVRDGRDAEGRFVALEADDFGRLAAVLAERRRDLSIERTEQWWRTRVFHGWGGVPYVYGWEREGELLGYVVYTFEGGESGERVLDVDELVAIDAEAERACLGFLADHDSQATRVRLYGPAEPTLLDVVEAPATVETRLHAGPMGRVVSVPAVLESVAYPADVTADLTLRVRDPVAAWNDGPFSLVVADGVASVEPVDATDDGPVLETDVGALSQLVVGYRSATSLASAGSLSGDRRAVETLERLLPPGDPFLRERF